MNKIEQITQVNDVSRLSLGTEIKGVLVSSSDIRIDGFFDGDIMTSGKLVLGEEAVVNGRLICISADIWGKVTGKIFAEDLTTLRNRSSFKGDLCTGRIGIEVGSEFSGSCKIVSHEEFVEIWDNCQKNDHKEMQFSNMPKLPEVSNI